MMLRDVQMTFRFVTTICLVYVACGMTPLAPSSLAQDPANAPARVVIRSTPPGGTILTGAAEPAGVTPDTVILAPGDYILQVGHEGYQYLSHRVDLEPDQMMVLDFILLPTPPEPRTPEEMGLEYWPVIPKRLEVEAEGVRRKYNAAAETFIIFPLSQGLIGMIAFDESNDFPAEELFYSGLALVAGSYFLGKYMYNRKQTEIQEANSSVESENIAAEHHNQEVDRTISRDHAEAVILWQNESAGRGMVLENN